MHNLKPIREALGVTQQVMAAGIGCTQGNIGHYERGQTLPPEMAKRVIEFAGSLGLVIGYDHIYGSKQPKLRRRKSVEAQSRADTPTNQT
ncbi:transcriptional regulator [Comamonas serinivorans]|uniref:Transcriptional regulator n=1 Tax=Comamonas serinivorans TaxID=1082851 RepID=A0A1Y0EMR9_9BURK|nr:helix-turn-helix transcriptional regulator [Comamonas serinivorans]ARU04730.1 transcriptional regulator [Comamonas serinivorans]